MNIEALKNARDALKTAAVELDSVSTESEELSDAIDFVSDGLRTVEQLIVENECTVSMVEVVISKIVYVKHTLSANRFDIEAAAEEHATVDIYDTREQQVDCCVIDSSSDYTHDTEL